MTDIFRQQCGHWFREGGMWRNYRGNMWLATLVHDLQFCKTVSSWQSAHTVNCLPSIQQGSSSDLPARRGDVTCIARQVTACSTCSRITATGRAGGELKTLLKTPPCINFLLFKWEQNKQCSTKDKTVKFTLSTPWRSRDWVDTYFHTFLSYATEFSGQLYALGKNAFTH